MELETASLVLADISLNTEYFYFELGDIDFELADIEFEKACI
jgi:hypothetical protein